MARPKISIDWETFDKLCAMQCTQVEIASFFGCSVDTIERACKREKKLNFAEYFQQKRKIGCVSLRRKMFEIAMTGNVTMMIWLSKHMLGYLDRVHTELKHSGEIETKVDREAAMKRLFKTEKTTALTVELSEELTRLEMEEDQLKRK